MRYVITFLALVLVLGGLSAVKGAQIAMLVAHGKAAAALGPPPEVIGTAIAHEDAWPSTISAVGSLASAKGVSLAADASGIVSRIRFESGDEVKQGDTIVELDTRVERAQLAAARAKQELAATTAARTRTLVEHGALPAAQRDADDAQLTTATKDAEALQAVILQKTVRAPFAGRLGIRLVNLGQFLNAGAPVAVLETVKVLYADFPVPQQMLGALSNGLVVHVVANGPRGGAPREGRIVAIDPSVDSVTRMVKVRATVPNEDEAMRPGMFVGVSVVLPQPERFVVVPQTAIVHASFGDSVFVVEDKPKGAPGMRATPDGKPVKVAAQRFVRTGEARGDFIAVLEGVHAGDEVVTAGTFKLRNGAPIVVDNTVQAKPSLHPTPENR